MNLKIFALGCASVRRGAKYFPPGSNRTGLGTFDRSYNPIRD